MIRTGALLRSSSNIKMTVATKVVVWGAGVMVEMVVLRIQATLNPKPQTLNPINPEPQTLNPKPYTLNPKPYKPSKP